MPVPMMKLSPELDNNMNHSTPQTMDIATTQLNVSVNCSTYTDENSDPQVSDYSNSSGSSNGSVKGSCGEKKASFYFEESCSQDSGLEADRGDSGDAKCLVCSVC